MSEVKVKFVHFEPKKHSIRMKTDERLGGQYPLADLYVPRSVLFKLGLSEAEQNDPQLQIFVSYSTNETQLS